MDEPVPIPGKPYIESEIVEFIEQHDRWDWVSQRGPRHIIIAIKCMCVCGFICSIM